MSFLENLNSLFNFPSPKPFSYFNKKNRAPSSTRSTPWPRRTPAPPPRARAARGARSPAPASASPPPRSLPAPTPPMPPPTSERDRRLGQPPLHHPGPVPPCARVGAVQYGGPRAQSDQRDGREERRWRLVQGRQETLRGFFFFSLSVIEERKKREKSWLLFGGESF